MDRQLKLWEVSLIFGILVALVLSCWLNQRSQEQLDLAEAVIRLHVVANSDSDDDQALKLEVRDAVLTKIQEFYPENADLNLVLTQLDSNLEEIQAVGQAVVTDYGYDYIVQTELTQSYFPTKDYDDFSLPAGNYTALKITLGEGDGQNWWCVAFPPLCLGATSETVEEAQTAGLFTADQVALITQSDQTYILKFKSIELLGMLQENLGL